MSVSKIDLAPWGFAPGDTFVFCVDCPDGIAFQAHRHSIRCVGHALNARLADIRAAEGQGKETPFGHNPIEIAIKQHEQRLLTCRDIFIVGIGLLALGLIYWMAIPG
jgi:hypothetical protein